jgi:hypothetical protein
MSVFGWKSIYVSLAIANKSHSLYGEGNHLNPVQANHVLKKSEIVTLENKQYNKIIKT